MRNGDLGNIISPNVPHLLLVPQLYILSMMPHVQDIPWGSWPQLSSMCLLPAFQKMGNGQVQGAQWHIPTSVKRAG